MRHVGQHVAHRRGDARHLQANVEAFLHPQLALDVWKGRAANVQRACRAHLPGKIESVLVDVGDHDVARASKADDRDGHQANRTGAGDQYICSQHREAERGVDGVAEGVEDGGDIKRDVGGMLPDVGHRQGDVLGESAVAVDTDALCVRAEVTPSGHAVAAAPTDQMPLAADEIARMKVVDVTTDLDNLADELVPDDQRDRDCALRPGVPVVDVEIRATDPSAEDADEQVVNADYRLWDILEPQAWPCLAFDQRLHRIRAPSPRLGVGEEARLSFPF